MDPSSSSTSSSNPPPILPPAIKPGQSATPAQGSQAPQKSGSAFGFYDPHGGALFSSTLTLISGISALNNFLEVFSKTVLQHDLKLDSDYAVRLGQLKFKQGTGSQTTLYNRNLEFKQSALQAAMKAHQNVESMDIQNASATTSNQQQLSSFISQTFQLIDQIANFISTMSR